MFFGLLVGVAGGLTASVIFHTNTNRHTGRHTSNWFHHAIYNEDNYDGRNNDDDYGYSKKDVYKPHSSFMLNCTNFAHRNKNKLPFYLSRNDYEVLALVKPTLEHVMNPEQDVKPIKAIVIGGGYSGARLSYLFDSLFDVTLIDNKNFFELTDDIIAFIANKWEEEKNVEALHKMMILHRYYLKRANVLTGRVNKVTATEVQLCDGREVPFDLLFIATGESKSFPFETQQRTRAGRREELKHFSNFLQTCHKIGIVGGGPTGTQLAAELAWTRPDAEIHLFHHGQELLPRLQRRCREYAENYLRKQPNVHVHLASKVTKVDCIVNDEFNIASVNDATDRDDSNADKTNNNNNNNSSNNNNKFTFHKHEENDKALSITRIANNKTELNSSKATRTDTAESTFHPYSTEHKSEESSQTHYAGWVNRLCTLLPLVKLRNVDWRISKNRSTSDALLAPHNKVKYTVHYDEYERTARLQESVLHQLYFGVNFGDSIRTRNGSGVGIQTTYQPSSSFHKEQQKLRTTKESEFDYVFSLMGNIARPISSHEELCALHDSNNDQLRRHAASDDLLMEHQMADGHYRVSRMLELFALPHVFAVGKCNNLPLVKSYGMSDTQCRALLRAMTSLLVDHTKAQLAEHNKLIVSRLQTPRLNIRLGYRDAVGSTPWGGGIVGMSALQEYALERNYLLRDFLQPTFFKRQDPLNVMKRINAWKEREITDVKDFSFA